MLSEQVRNKANYSSVITHPRKKFDPWVEKSVSWLDAYGGGTWAKRNCTLPSSMGVGYFFLQGALYGRMHMRHVHAQ